MIGLYRRYLSIQLRGQMQYRTSFMMTVLGQFLSSFSAFLTIYFLMGRFHSVAGFSFSQVLLCFGVIMMSFSLAECFFRGFDTFNSMIGNGQFDRMLVRPHGLVFQVVASKVDFARLGKLVQAVLVFGYAIPNCGVIWTADKVLTLALMVLCGMLVFCGLFVVYASVCFFTLEGLEVMNIFTDGGRTFGQYPFSIYGEGILKFFTYVIPLALFQYYPFLYLIGKTSDRRYMLSPLAALVFLVPCGLLWRFGVRHYKSTGS